LRALTPIDAVQAWLDGDFGIGDEPALNLAIRSRYSCFNASNDIIEGVILDAMNAF